MSPAAWVVESKSLKLYLGLSAATALPRGLHAGLAQRLVAVSRPVWLRIGGYWYPRGGIPIDIFWQTGAPPGGAWIPDQGVAPYRGRG